VNARILAQASRLQNRVTLLELRDEHHRPGDSFGTPPLFVIVLYVHDRGQKAQHWTRTELEPDVARELYDQAVSEFIAKPFESEPSFIDGAVV
jgi:hypothetical protein